MPISIEHLARSVRPSETFLLLGAGSSMPSGAPSGDQLKLDLAKQFSVTDAQYLSLSEVATIVELDYGRAKLIEFVREKVEKLVPTGGVLNLPRFDWNCIVTTNYDKIIEKSYARLQQPLQVISSNFDFQSKNSNNSTQLFKVHGTSDKDVSIGNQERIIITQEDYELTSQYRDMIFDRMRFLMSGSSTLIIGHSLLDPDLNNVIEEALRRQKESGAGGRLYVLSFSKNDAKAKILEKRGITVAFGGLDEFVGALHKAGPDAVVVATTSDDPLDFVPSLRPATIEVGHASKNLEPNALKMFNGAPAGYADIAANLTFQRDLVPQLSLKMSSDDKFIHYLLAPAGFGKTTTARSVLLELERDGFICYEHRPEFQLNWQDWTRLANKLKVANRRGAIFIDDCHLHMNDVTSMVDELVKGKNSNLKILLVSSAYHWRPRVKSPYFFLHGEQHDLGVLSTPEIHKMIDLLDRRTPIYELVEREFQGFSRQEKIRRLKEKCASDMFVCLKAMFSTSNIDDIILKDYSNMEDNVQRIYRIVCALEASGLKVHRQTIMRILGIDANSVGLVLDMMKDVITEYDINRKAGVFGWSGRHIVIANIIMNYKYNSQDEILRLYELFIDNLNITYDIEKININEICDIKFGIGRIHDRDKQNYLFRKLISISPSARVPRHRLIRNLIKAGAYEQAGNEIRLFEVDCKTDAPIVRYRATLAMERAKNVTGLMDEDRIAILRDAARVLDAGISRFSHDVSLYRALGDLGLQFYRLTASWEIFDEAIAEIKRAELKYFDPEFNRTRGNLELRAKNQSR